MAGCQAPHVLLTGRWYADSEGSAQLVLTVMCYAGLDTGVMLFRNSDWSRTFVDDALAYLGDEAKQVSSMPYVAVMP